MTTRVAAFMVAWAVPAGTTATSPALHPPHLVAEAEVGLALQEDDDLVVVVVDVRSQAPTRLDGAHRAGGPLGSLEVGDPEGLPFGRIGLSSITS